MKGRFYWRVTTSKMVQNAKSEVRTMVAIVQSSDGGLLVHTAIERGQA